MNIDKFIDGLVKSRELKEFEEKIKTVNVNQLETKPVDLNTFIFSPEYIGLKKVSPKQARLLMALDNMDPDSNQYKEFIVVVGKGCVTGDTIFDGVDKTAKQLYDSKGAPLVLSDYNGIKKLQGSPLWKDAINYPVFEVELEDGKKIKVSEGHQFYTRDGWKHLCELEPNDEVAIMG